MSAQLGWNQVRDDSGRPQFKKKKTAPHLIEPLREEVGNQAACVERAFNLVSCHFLIGLSRYGRCSCSPERVFNLDTCVNCELPGKDGGHLAERMKVQHHHRLIELVGEIHQSRNKECRNPTSTPQKEHHVSVLLVVILLRPSLCQPTHLDLQHLCRLLTRLVGCLMQRLWRRQRRREALNPAPIDVPSCCAQRGLEAQMESPISSTSRAVVRGLADGRG